MADYKLIVPQDNWRNPIQITEADFPLIKAIGKNLNCLVNIDKERHKVYMKLNPNKGEASVYEPGVRFPELTLPYVKEVGSSNAYYAPHAKKGHLFAVTSTTRKLNLSLHFNLSEFICHDTYYQKYVRIHPELIEVLEAIRKRLEAPMFINSAYRPISYNAAIGGESGSWHIAGCAADISTAADFHKLANIAEVVVGNKGGVGLYPNDGFVHVDVRGYASRW